MSETLTEISAESLTGGQAGTAVDRQALAEGYRRVRGLSMELTAPLQPEEYRIQSMPDVSPPWWNLGHTTWFFAKNVLEPHGAGAADDGRYEYVLNSYYESLGPRLPRAQRGLVSRPTNAEVLAYRRSVDGRMAALLASAPEASLPAIAELMATGLQHEQQHQELLLTELKHIFWTVPPPLRAAYPLAEPVPGGAARAPRWVEVAGGVVEIGNREGGWCWDNELAVHRAHLEPFALLDRLVTAGEYLEFIADGGYRQPLLWLSNGWAKAKEEGWQAPLYWWLEGGAWWQWTLAGARLVAPAEPVAHVSFYEADAFARWKAASATPFREARLPTEREWEHAARQHGFAVDAGNFLDRRHFHPRPAPAGEGLVQMAGDLWEWTSNHYEAYPGYRPFDGNLMEYNGKFMDNQRVLRGGSCATPADHIRPSYRNFWPAATRFQMTGIRLARSL